MNIHLATDHAGLELKNAIKRAVIMCDGKRITPTDLGLESDPSVEQSALVFDLKDVRGRRTASH